MKPLNVIIFASILAVAGKWAQKKTVDGRMIVGGATLAITFAVLQDAQPKLAESFSWLILASVAGAYGENVFSTIGELVNGTRKIATGQNPNSGPGVGGGTPTRAQ